MTLPAFNDPKFLIERANEQLVELSGLIIEVSKAINVVQVIEREEADYVVKARIVGALPYRLSIVAKDIIGNLRDSLDHAVHASATTINGGEPRKTKFMAGRDAAAIRNDIKRGSYADVPKSIMDLMWDLQPYQGGHPLLDTFNKLRNVKTHRVLVPFVYKNESITLNLNSFGAGGFHLKQMGGSDIWDEKKQELILARLETSPAGAEFHASFDIVIPGTDIAGKPQPALPFLNAAASEFARIVTLIERETAKTISTDNV